MDAHIALHPSLETFPGLTVHRSVVAHKGFLMLYCHLAFGGSGGVNLKLMQAEQFPKMVPTVAEVLSLRGISRWLYADEFSRVEDKRERLIARLAMSGTDPVIAFVEKGIGGHVVYVRSMRELIACHDLKGACQLYDLKRQAAEFLDLQWVTSANEAILLQNRADAQAAAVREREAAEAYAKSAAKAARIASVMARPKLKVYGSKGETRHGVPALVTEWPSLEHKTSVVVVESYTPAAEDGAAVIGAPVEYFQVLKVAGKNPQKTKLIEKVSLSKDIVSAVSAGPELPAQIGHVVIQFKTLKTSVPVFASVADAGAHRTASKIMVPWYVVDDGSERTLYKIVGDEVETVGRADFEFMDDSKAKAA